MHVEKKKKKNHKLNKKIVIKKVEAYRERPNFC